MKEPKKILVRSPNWIGDQVLAYPFYYFLRKAYPKAHITSLCVPWVEAVQFRDLVDQVVVLPRPRSPEIFDRFRAMEDAGRLLRKQGPWDLGISLPNSFSAAWILFRAGAKVRRGYSADGRGFLLNQSIPWVHERVEHRSDAYLKLLPFEGTFSGLEFWGTFPDNDLDPKIPGVLESFNAAKAWGNSPLEPPSEKYWVLAPGATAESRRWPTDRFAQLARNISKETGWKGIVVGGAAEADLANDLQTDSSLGLENWTNRGSVASYWKVFRNAQFTVGNDSGLSHVAALCGSPVQVIWGAGDSKRTQPIGPGRVKISIHPVECWPCESNSCFRPFESRNQCLVGIQGDQVWKEIQSGIGIHF